jgi:DNA mismatch endonuclease, patch repair protein
VCWHQRIANVLTPLYLVISSYFCEMTDNRTKIQRSYNMSRIHSTNTKPEILVRKYLFKNGFRYRLHLKELPGKPDIVIRKLETVIFINGCFWHSHKNCKNAKTPVANRKFWIDKITANSERDKKNVRRLKNEGWKVLIIWECQLHPHKAERSLAKLLTKLQAKKLKLFDIEPKSFCQEKE